MAARSIRQFLDLLAALAMIVASATIIWVSVKTPSRARDRSIPLPSDAVSLVGFELRGSKDAPIAIIEFADFECPFCASFVHETWPALDRLYVHSGKVKVAFSHLPLEAIHTNAFRAAVAAQCAGKEGRFWEMHAALFRQRGQLSSSGIDAQALAIGLSGDRFSDCLDGPAVSEVKNIAAAAKQLGVRATPTFFIGHIETDGRVRVKQILNGVRSVGDFAVAIDRLLEERSDLLTRTK